MHEIEMLGLLDHDVLSSIELPLLPEFKGPDPLATPRDPGTLYKSEADKFDMDVFAIQYPKPPTMTRGPISGSGSGSTVPGSLLSSLAESAKRVSVRSSDMPRIPPIEESPIHPPMELPPETVNDTPKPNSRLLPSGSNMEILSTSPSQSSIRSIHSNNSNATATTLVETDSQPPTPSRAAARSRFSLAWLANTFRTGISQPQTSAVSASGVSSPAPSGTDADKLQPLLAPLRPSAPAPIPRSPRPPPKPMAIQGSSFGRSGLARNSEEDALFPHRGSLGRHSPMNTPPRDDVNSGGHKRRSGTASSGAPPLGSSSSPAVRTNPSKPLLSVPYTMSSLARRWQHLFPQPLSKHDIKWKCMITPACLPITTEFFPAPSELENGYDVSSYEFVVDPSEMRSFLVKAPASVGAPDAIRPAFALAVMRGMVAQRLALGFQFILRPSKWPHSIIHDGILRRSGVYTEEDPMTKPFGAAEFLLIPDKPTCLSMSNEIHKISYSGDAIRFKRYVRRMPKTQPYDYKCLIWPKLGVGYTALITSFASHGLENYGWNR